MRLKKMEFQRDDYYGANEKPMLGKLEFAGSYGNIMIKVPEELCQKILELCAELIRQRINEATQHMISSVISHANRLENKE